MTTNSQRSFASGEISPSLYQRVDFFKYATGLTKCYNALIQRHGGWSNRPGSIFVGETKPETNKLVPFVLSSNQSYVLEFGDKSLKFIRDGQYIMEDEVGLTGKFIGGGEAYFVAGTSDIFTEGETYYVVPSEDAPPGLVGKFVLAGTGYVTGSEFGFKILNMDGTSADTSVLDDWSSGGSIRKVYEIETPYELDEIADIQYVQSSSTLTVVHQNHTPRDITRTDDTDWEINELVFEPSIDAPVLDSITKGGSGSNDYRYIVTAVKRYTFEESLPGKKFDSFIYDSGVPENSGDIDFSNPMVIPLRSGHGLSDNDLFYIQSEDLPGLGDSVFKATDVDTDYFGTTYDVEIGSLDGTKYSELSPTPQWKSGDSIYVAELTIDSASEGTLSNPHVIRWESVQDAVEYNVYKAVNGVYGLLAVVGEPVYRDIGATPDTSIQPNLGRNPFDAPGDRPGSVTYIQQRLALGNTINEPQKVITSKAGEYKNFATRNPITDSDSITFNMVGRQLNEVRHMLDLGKLVILTSGGEWSAQGGADGVITPTDINLRQHSYNGANKLPPVIVDGSALYVQARGSIIRDLGFNFEIDGYQGNDLTIFSSHLFDNYTITDWCYQQTPNSIVWAVRDDGSLLGLTLVREQQMLAWHRHDFQNGTVKSITAIPSGSEDTLYLSIERTINGKTVKYIEHLSTRKIDDIIDSKFLDCNKTYDGRNTDTDHTMELTADSPGEWTYEDDLTITSSEAYFSSSDVGNAIHFTADNGDEIRIEITAYLSTTTVTGRTVNQDVPEELQETATSDWSKGVDTITGLHQLEGEEVSVFADRNVVSSPNNEDVTTLTVENGEVTLTRPYAVIHIGLPYLSDLETLNIDSVQGQTLANKKINISQVTAFIESSRGGFIGGNDPGTTNPLENLEDMTVRQSEGYSDPISLFTGKHEVNIPSEWDSNGKIFIRQVDPLPLSVLAVYPSGKIPY